MQIVEHGRTVLQSLTIGGKSCRDAAHQCCNPRRFRPAERVVLAIDVVHYFTNGHEGTIIKAEPTHQRLESACVANVGVLGPRHVKTQLTRPHLDVAGADESESRLWINDPPDQSST